MIEKIAFDSIHSEDQLLLTLRNSIKETNSVLIEPLIHVLASNLTLKSISCWSRLSSTARDYIRKSGTVSSEFAALSLFTKIKILRFELDADREELSLLLREYLNGRTVIRTIAYSSKQTSEDSNFNPKFELNKFENAYNNLLAFIEKRLQKKGILQYHNPASEEGLPISTSSHQSHLS